MTFRSIIKLFIPNFLLKIYRNRYKHETIKKFSFDVHSPSDVKKDIQEKYGHNSELLELFANNKDFTVHKWHHYIPIYDRYFSSFRGGKIRFLEIGVGEGGSLRMWRKYFGNNAIISLNFPLLFVPINILFIFLIYTRNYYFKYYIEII